MANKTKKNAKDKATSEPKVNGATPTDSGATASSSEAEKVKFMI